MAGISQFFSYPSFFVEVTLSNAPDDDGGKIAFWINNFSLNQIPDASGPNFESVIGQGPTGHSNEVGVGYLDGPNEVICAPLVQAVTDWARGFDWGFALTGTTDTGITAAEVKVTKYTETAQDVTPTP